jgi:hypothetical protein
MKGSCPIKTSPDWVALETALGEDNAYKIWLDTPTEEMLEPIKAAFYLYAEENRDTAARLLNENISKYVKSTFNQNTTLFDMIDSAFDPMFNDPLYKDWLQSKGFLDKIFEGETVKRTPEAEIKEQNRVTTLTELAEEVPPLGVKTDIEVADIHNRLVTNDLIKKYANKFITPKYNIQFSVITAAEAEIIKQGSNTPYKGEAIIGATDKAGQSTVYYIQDRININTEFHKLAYPLVMLLKKDNIKEFNRIYESIAATPEGIKAINTIHDRYPEMTNEAFHIFREKVLLESLKMQADNTRLISYDPANALTLSEPFNKAVNDMMGNFKTTLRVEFKTGSLSKKDNLLTPLSTLKDIGNLFALKADKAITPEELNTYTTDQERAVKELLDTVNRNPNKVKIEERLEEIIQPILKTVKAQLNEINSKKGYANIKKELADPESGPFLTEMSGYMQFFRKDNPEIVKNLESLSEKHKALHVVNTLFTLEAMLLKSNEYLNKLYKSEAPIEEKVLDAENFDRLLKSWLSFIKETEKNLIKAGIDRGSFLYGYVSRLDVLVDDGVKTIKEIQKVSSVTATTDLLKSFSEKVIKDIDAEIARVTDTKGNEAYKQKKLAQLRADKEKYDFTKEKVEALYGGKLGDANWWSTMFISYTSDPDPIIATFALYLKKHISQITSRAFIKADNFAKNTEEARKNLGMTGVNHQSDWKDNGFTMIDYKPGRDENGNLISEEVISLMAPVKNWRYDSAKMRDKIDKARQAGDEAAIKAAYEEKEQIEQLFNREYVPQYYKDRELLKKENPKAYEALKKVDNQIAEHKVENTGELEFFENYDILTTLLNERKRLFSLYNEDNVLKSQEEQDIAKALIEHRKRTGKYYESIERKGALQRAAEGFAQLVANNPKYAGVQLYNGDGTLTPEFSTIMQNWIAQNTTVRYTQAYYDKVNEIYDRLAELSKDLPADYQLAESYAKMTSILLGFKDNNGQFNPALLDSLGPVKKEEKIAEIKQLQEYIDELIYEQKYNPVDDIHLTEAEKRAQILFKAAITELGQIQYKEATSYYLEDLNNELIKMGLDPVDTTGADEFIGNQVLIDNLLDRSKEFRNWFEKNHVQNWYKTKKGEQKFNYKRLNAHSVARPKDDPDNPQYYITGRLNINGNILKFDGVPNAKYFYFRVKNEYRTVPFGLSEEEKAKNYVGKVIDNKGHFLPLTKEQAAQLGVPTSIKIKDENGQEVVKSYINEEYYNVIQNADKKHLLETITNYHIDNQIGLEGIDKLYLDIPRIRIKQHLEAAQTGQLTRRWSNWLKNVKAGAMATLSGKTTEEANALSREISDADEGLVNADEARDREELIIAKDGIIDPVMDRIPMKGMAKIPIEEVSYDLMSSFNFYMLQAERQKVFTEINPMAKAMLSTLEDTDQGVMKINALKEKQFSMTDSLKALSGNKNETVRTAAFRALYNREFKGEMFSEKNLDWVNKVTNSITGAAAINYFALNLPSAIKNYWGMMWQSNIEAIGGDRTDPISLAKARAKVNFEIMPEWSTKVWGGKLDTLNTQMVMMWDPTQGKTEDVISRNYSRTFAGDLASLSWTYSPRKYMEMQGALQVFYSMMYHKKIEQTVDGRTINIAYADAFELNDKKQLTLKPGIDPKYGISYDEKGIPTLGSEFLSMQNSVHEKFKDLNGAFAKFEHPQAQQFFAYRLFAFMRRYFTSMFMYRFGSKRANFALDEVRTGYYMEAIKAVGQTLISLGKSIPYMSPKEKQAMVKVLADVAQIFIISAAAALLFGFDDDDEDRFEKLRAKSGALGSDDFQLAGWLSNHALTLLLKTQAENQSFIPLPTVGLKNYLDFTSTTSLAFGPTISAYTKILTDLTKHAMPGEDESLFYKRDTGPYAWQDEGSAKIWNHLGSMLGFSGSQVDPVKGLQSFDSFGRQ